MSAETYSLLAEAFTTNSDAFCTISEAFLRLRNLLLLFRCTFTRILTDIHSFGRGYQLFGYLLPKFGSRFVIAEAVSSLRKLFRHCGSRFIIAEAFSSLRKHFYLFGSFFTIADTFLSFRKPFHFFGDNVFLFCRFVYPCCEVTLAFINSIVIANYL